MNSGNINQQNYAGPVLTNGNLIVPKFQIHTVFARNSIIWHREIPTTRSNWNRGKHRTRREHVRHVSVHTLKTDGRKKSGTRKIIENFPNSADNIHRPRITTSHNPLRFRRRRRRRRRNRRVCVKVVVA